jgi:hypothetical protein
MGNVTVSSRRLETIRFRMASSGMLRRVALVRAEVSEEFSASFIRVTRIGVLGTTMHAAKKYQSVARYS